MQRVVSLVTTTQSRSLFLELKGSQQNPRHRQTRAPDVSLDLTVALYLQYKFRSNGRQIFWPGRAQPVMAELAFLGWQWRRRGQFDCEWVNRLRADLKFRPHNSWQDFTCNEQSGASELALGISSATKSARIS